MTMYIGLSVCLSVTLSPVAHLLRLVQKLQSMTIQHLIMTLDPRVTHGNFY